MASSLGSDHSADSQKSRLHFYGCRMTQWNFPLSLDVILTILCDITPVAETGIKALLFRKIRKGLKLSVWLLKVLNFPESE